jgi:hypothetical protein
MNSAPPVTDRNARDDYWASFDARLKSQTSNLAEPPSVSNTPTFSKSNSVTPPINNPVGPTGQAPTFSTVPEFSAKKTNTIANNEFSAKKKEQLVKTSLPKLADLNYTESVSMLKQVSNYLNLINGLENEVQISLDYYSALQKTDIVSSLSNFYSNLNSSKMPVLKNDFVDFWVKRFHCTAEPLKSFITGNLKTDSSSFFTELSDSIGILVNSRGLLDDSTIPVTDITTDIYSPPNIIPVQLKNKISSTTLNVSYALSRYNTELMRQNLKRVYFTSNDANPYAYSTDPHGSNLVSDLNTYIIINNNLQTYYDKLKSSYNRIFSYIEYISNVNNSVGYNPRDISGSNQQIITDLIFSLDVEKFKISVDLLQRKFKSLLSYKTIQNTLSNNTTINT